MDHVVEIAVIVLLTVLNGVFSMSETAVISARKARLQHRANAGDARAQAALELASHPDRFLSTVQIGITLIGILAGAYGGAGLAKDLAASLVRAGLSEAVSESLAFGIVVVGITYLSLVLGELAPKRLALNNPEGIASLVARPMRRLSALAGPVVTLLSVSTNLLLRLFAVRPSSEPPVTEEEINILIAQATVAGVFEPEEREMVQRVLQLGERRARQLMTPRPEIVWLDLEDPPEVNQQKIAAAHHSSFPLCRGSLDNVAGIVALKHLWERSSARQPGDPGSLDLEAVAQPGVFVPENTPAPLLLKRFKEGGQHLVLVIDEYGGTMGLVTLHDVLEAILGDVFAGGEPGEQAVVRREDGSLLLDGQLPIDEFQRVAGLAALPHARGDYDTLGGFIMTQLGRVPQVGEQLEWAGLRFEVVDMDGNRIDRVLVAPPASQSPQT